MTRKIASDILLDTCSDCRTSSVCSRNSHVCHFQRVTSTGKTLQPRLIPLKIHRKIMQHTWRAAASAAFRNRSAIDMAGSHKYSVRPLNIALAIVARTSMSHLLDPDRASCKIGPQDVCTRDKAAR